MPRQLTLLLCCLAFVIPLSTQAEDNELEVLATRFPELKVMQSRNMPVRIAKEDWSRARNIIETDAGWSRWVTAHQVALDRWMSKPRDRSEWVAGDMHGLIDPSTNLPLKWSENMPEPVSVTGGDQKLKQAWVAWGRTNNFGMIAEAARLYRLTGKQQYGDWAAAQLDFYADNYARWPLRDQAGKARMMDQGLDEATAMPELVEAVRLLKDMVPEERLRRWRDQLFFPIANNLSGSRHNVDNIRLWHSAAMVLIGIQFDEERLVQEGLDGPKGIRKILKAGVTNDFIWYEGSFGYQTYVLRALVPVFVQASLHGRAQDFQKEMLIAQNMLLAPLLFRFDDGMLPTPGDSGTRLSAVNLNLHFEMYRTLPTRIGLIEASRRKSWDTLLDPVVGELPVAAQLPQVRSTDFDSIRMAVLKSDDWQIFIRYGQIVPQHAQEDALSTEIYFKDVPVSISPGTVAYGSKLHSEYFHRAVSHNVPMVDGHGQTGWDRGLMNSFDAVGASLEASQPNYRPDATAVRRVFIKDGQLVDHVALHLKQGIAGEKRLGFLFHWDCELELVKDQLGTEAVAVPPRGDGFAFWDQIRVRQAPKNWQAKLGCGKQDFAVEVSTSTPSNVYTAKAPSKPVPAKRAVIYIEITGRDATVEIRLKPVNLSQPPVMQ